MYPGNLFGLYSKILGLSLIKRTFMNNILRKIKAMARIRPQ